MAKPTTSVRARSTPPDLARSSTPAAPGRDDLATPGQPHSGKSSRSSMQGAAAGTVERPAVAVRRQKPAATQTSGGEVLWAGRPRQFHMGVVHEKTPSKAECLSEQRLLQLVRDGTYDEVLSELEAAPAHDVEAAWLKSKLLRIVAKHRQKMYGSIRNPVTSKQKHLTPEKSARTAQADDLQLPARDREPVNSVVLRMMNELALHNNIPPPQPERSPSRQNTDAAMPHNERGNSPGLYSHTVRPESSGALTGSEHSRVLAAGLSGSGRGSPLTEQDRVSTRGSLRSSGAGGSQSRQQVSRTAGRAGDGKGSRASYASLPLTSRDGFFGPVMRDLNPAAIFKGDKPGFDSSAIATINHQEYSNVSALLQRASMFPHAHSPSPYSARGDSASNESSKAARSKLWLEDAPKKGSVAKVLEETRKEADAFITTFRTVRRQELQTAANEAASRTGNNDGRTDDARQRQANEAFQLWAASFDAFPPLEAVDASRVAAAMQLAQATEKNEKKMTDKHKGVIQDIMKTDVIADALLKEEMMAQSIAKTKVDMAKLAVSLAEAAQAQAVKRAQAVEDQVKRSAMEVSMQEGRLAEEQAAACTSADELAMVTAERDYAAQDVAAQEKDISGLNKAIAELKAKIIESEALVLDCASVCLSCAAPVCLSCMLTVNTQALGASHASNQAEEKAHSEKAEELRTKTKELRGTLLPLEEKLRSSKDALRGFDEDVARAENQAEKDRHLVQQVEKLVMHDRKKLTEIENNFQELRQVAQELETKAQERQDALQEAREILAASTEPGGIAPPDSASGKEAQGTMDGTIIETEIVAVESLPNVQDGPREQQGRQDGRKAEIKERDQHAENLARLGVIERLRACSLALCCKMMRDSDDPDIKTDETEPLYLGERENGQRHGLGMLQFAAGAEYLGEFKNDEPHGFGIERYADGTSFQGWLPRLSCPMCLNLCEPMPLHLAAVLGEKS